MPRDKQLYDKQNEYNRSKYDHFNLMLPKGTKEQLQAIAKERGMSLNGLMTEAVSIYTGLYVQNVQKKGAK